MNRPDPTSDHAGWEDRVLAALDGRADAAERAALGRHLAECASCRELEAEYREILARLRELPEAEPAPDAETARTRALPPRFWDDLASDIERRIASEEEPAGCGTPEPAAGGGSAPEVVPLHTRWNGVAGGLAAACLAVVLLVALYLELPRPAGEPQAFTVAVRAAGPADGDLPAGVGSSPAAIPELEPGYPAAAWLAGVPVEDAPPDPLATLADPSAALAGLTPAETEDVLLTLETEI